jgi:chromosome segregation ATPase
LQLAQKNESASATEQIKALQSKLDQHTEERDALKIQLADAKKEYQTAIDRSKSIEAKLEELKQDSSKPHTELALAKQAAKRLEEENQQLETRALEAEEKVSLLLDQVETSVDTYRRSIVTKRTDGNSPPISPRSSSVGNRTSMALDSLAHELDQLRSHWESSTARYRLSTASSLGHESPTRPIGLGLLHPYELESPRAISNGLDRKVNGIQVHEDDPVSRWRDDNFQSPATHLLGK